MTEGIIMAWHRKREVRRSADLSILLMADENLRHDGSGMVFGCFLLPSFHFVLVSWDEKALPTNWAGCLIDRCLHIIPDGWDGRDGQWEEMTRLEYSCCYCCYCCYYGLADV